MEFANKVALVTGGSLGIGRAVAAKLAAEGASIAINYRKHADEATQVVNQIREKGGKAIAVQADVAKFSDAQRMVEQVRAELGGLHILVNNAGINWDGVVWKMEEEQWDRVIEVNLKGYFNYIRAAAPVFREQKYGKIINVTSINGLRGKFGQTNYSAAKAGVVGLTKAVARELGKSNVNVNAVALGLIETDMVKSMPEEAKAQSLADIVIGRIGQPEDVANVVAFLVSDGARHITGDVIKVDGGQYI